MPFFRLLARLCSRALDLSAKNSPGSGAASTEAASSTWRFLLCCAIAALSGPEGVPLAFAGVLATTSLHISASYSEPLAAEWVSRVLAPPFQHTLRSPILPASLAHVASLAPKASLEAAVKGLVRLARDTAEDVSGGVPHEAGDTTPAERLGL